MHLLAPGRLERRQALCQHSLQRLRKALHQHDSRMQQHRTPLSASTAQQPVCKSRSPSVATGLLTSWAIFCRYSLWRLGEHRIITRAPAHAALQVTASGPYSAAAVVQAKMEYHGNKAADAEEVTAEELVRWWSAAHLRPGAHVLVRSPPLMLLISERLHTFFSTPSWGHCLLG